MADIQISAETLRAQAQVAAARQDLANSDGFELQQELGGVRLRQGTRMGPAPSGLTIAITAMPDKEERIIARRLAEYEANMRATVEGIKRLAEAEQ